MKHKKKTYNLGGLTGSSKGELIGQGIGMAANLILPGIGQVLSPLFGAMGQKTDALQTEQDRINQLNTSVNPYQYKMGGELEDNMYKGLTHEQGGININEEGIPAFDGDLEVEDNEYLYTTKDNKQYIFSDLLDAQEGISFSEKAASVAKKYPSKDFNDIERETFFLEMDRLRTAQEGIKSVIEEDMDVYRKGGYLKNKNTYVTKDGKSTRRGLWANVYLKKKREGKLINGGFLNPYAADAMVTAASHANNAYVTEPLPTNKNYIDYNTPELGLQVTDVQSPQKTRLLGRMYENIGDSISRGLSNDYAPAAIGQGVESLINLGILAGGVDKEVNRFNPYEQDVRRLTDQNIDLTQASNNIRSQFNVGLESLNNMRSANLRNAMVQNLVSGSQNSLANQALTAQQMNIGLDTQQAQVLSNLGQQRVQNQVYTDDIRARNVANYENEISKFGLDIADAGKGLTSYRVNKSANKMLFDILNKKYPDLGISSDVFDKYIAGKYDEINPDDLVVLKRLHQSNVNLFNNGK